MHDLARFADSVLRGLGQVMFQNNSFTGLLFLAGIAWNSLLLAIGALFGTVIATLTALALGADRTAVRTGLFGFNGALTAIALLFFLEAEALTWACIILASACSTILMAAMMAAFRNWNLPALTAPFVFTTLVFLLAAVQFGGLHPTDQLPMAGLPNLTSIEGVVTLTTFGKGVLNGIAQVFFQENPVTGLCFLAGLVVASRLACLAALIGSLAGLLVSWGMDAAEPALRAGVFGFNSVLTGIALASVFLKPGTPSLVYALLGAIVTPFVAAACAAALLPLGLPAMTLPFVLTTWVFLFASREFRPLAP